VLGLFSRCTSPKAETPSASTAVDTSPGAEPSTTKAPSTLTAATAAQGAFPHRWALMFLVAVGFWNFLGAGIFGFLINLPIVSYYEIGTALTSNHGHASMMGVYGMLAAGLAMFAVRYLIPDQRWPERLAKLSFWSLNLGLAWMVFATLFPIGLLQLERSVSIGYFEARETKYLTTGYLSFIEWMRLPGDVVFIGGGVLPLLWICLQGVRYVRGPDLSGGTDSALFTEVTRGERGQMSGATAAGVTEELA